MRLPGFLRRLAGRPPQDGPAPQVGAGGATSAHLRVTARYDAAQTTDRNRRYWQHADGLGPVAAHSAEVRYRIRTRARYERQNNGYLAGLTKTLAHDLVGSGPRLQLTAEGAERPALRRVERAYAAWCRAVGLTDKLRLMAEAAPTDGESFGVMAVNDRVRHPVKLDLRVVECDRVAPPGFGPEPEGQIDGVEYDAAGNPVRYHVLRQHPGDDWTVPGAADGDWFPAERVVHWFRADRPGQLRGVSQLAAAMTVSPQLRRLTLASLAAAEHAASHAGVLETDLPPDATAIGGGEGAADGEAGASLKAGESVPVELDQLTALPGGWKLSQLEAKHPGDRYKEFKGELINEMGRGLNAPFCVVAGNSAGYNYSSSRLDHRLYYQVIWCDRDRFGRVVLDPLFLAWVEFAARTPGLDGLFDGLPPVAEWGIDWHWDSFASIDPQKDATATEKRLAVGVTTLAEECAAEGKDWVEVLEQRAKERELARSLGLPPDPAEKPAMSQSADPTPSEEAANAP